MSTGEESAAQLLLIDETSLDVGPNSEVTLDRFGYDPSTRGREIVFRTGKGVFRLVTGSADPTSYSLRTPTATIGVHGPVSDIIVDPFTIICVEATIEVVLPDGTLVSLDAAGQAVTIGDDGSVQGPFAWVGAYQRAVVGLAFPSYVLGFLGEPLGNDWNDLPTSEDQRTNKKP